MTAPDTTSPVLAGKPCDCKSDIEAKLTDRFKTGKPEAKDHSVSLESYGFAIVGNTMLLKPFMYYKARAMYPSKTGGPKQKTVTGTMAFSFCPFCGNNLDAAVPVASQGAGE